MHNLNVPKTNIILMLLKICCCSKRNVTMIMLLEGTLNNVVLNQHKRLVKDGAVKNYL